MRLMNFKSYNALKTNKRTNATTHRHKPGD